MGLVRELLLPWLSAFVLTQLVEVPIYLLAQRRSARPLPARAIVGFIASALTHPVVWFVFPEVLERLPWEWMVACAELFAIVVEALWLRACGVPRPLFWSVIANGASFSTGLISRWLIGWP
jgi:hypothetical protein